MKYLIFLFVLNVFGTDFQIKTNSNNNTIPFPKALPTFLNLPSFTDDVPPADGWWTEGDYAWIVNPNEYVTEFGPSIRSMVQIPAKKQSVLWINPPEFYENGVAVKPELIFYFQNWEHGLSDSSIWINGIFQFYLPVKHSWTLFKTNLNISIINKLEFRVRNQNTFLASPSLMLDALGMKARTTNSVINGSTNFVVTPLNNGAQIKWNNNVFNSSFKLYGSMNLTNFNLIGSGTVTNNWSYVFNTNSYFKLISPN
jgi:hypothetical protein